MVHVQVWLDGLDAPRFSWAMSYLDAHGVGEKTAWKIRTVDKVRGMFAARGVSNMMDLGGPIDAGLSEFDMWVSAGVPIVRRARPFQITVMLVDVWTTAAGNLCLQVKVLDIEAATDTAVMVLRDEEAD